MQLIRLTIRHPCPYSTPLAASPESHVTHLCHRAQETLLEVHGEDPAALERILQEYSRQGGEPIVRGEETSASLVRFPSCSCCRSGRVIPILEAEGLLYLPPSAYGKGGEEVYQFLSPTSGTDRHLLDRLPENVTVVAMAVRPLDELEFENGFLVPMGALFQEVTPRQRQALVTAVRHGYYRIPRPITTAELAAKMDISREAFETLLRKAENKLVTAMLPYLVLGETGQPESPKERTE